MQLVAGGEGATAEIGVVRSRIVSGFRLYSSPLLWTKARANARSDFRGQLALQGKRIGQGAIINLRPKGFDPFVSIN